MRWDDILQKIKLLNDLLQRFDLSVVEIVRRYQEPDFYLKILGFDEWTDKDLEDLVHKIHGTRHHRNHRDERTYVANLLLGWIVQDFVEILLSYKCYQCHKIGSDTNRQLLRGARISEEPVRLIGISN